MTTLEVAEWMLDKIKNDDYLYQADVVYAIESECGSEFIYYNDSGNPAIDRKVLREFEKLTRDTVVWSRRERYWRMREDYDPAGCRQVD